MLNDARTAPDEIEPQPLCEVEAQTGQAAAAAEAEGHGVTGRQPAWPQKYFLANPRSVLILPSAREIPPGFACVGPYRGSDWLNYRQFCANTA